MHRKRCNSADNIIYSQQSNFKKRLKIKTTQNIFSIKTEIDSSNSKLKISKTKQTLYSVAIDRVSNYTKNY